MTFMEWNRSYQFFPEKKHGEVVNKPKKKRKEKINTQQDIIVENKEIRRELKDENNTKEYKENLVKLYCSNRDASAKMYASDNDLKKGIIAGGIAALATVCVAVGKMTFAELSLVPKDLDPENETMMKKRRSQFSAVSNFTKGNWGN